MKRRQLCNILAALFSISIVVPVTAMIFDRAPVLEFTDHGIIEPNPVAPNTTATITWKATQLRPCGGSVKRQVIHSESGRITDYASQEVVFRGTDIGVEREYSRSFIVPSLPGKYIHRAIVERWCNPLQKLIPAFRISDPGRTVWFEVK